MTDWSALSQSQRRATLRALVDASGLSVRDYAATVLRVGSLRLSRWLSGARLIPDLVPMREGRPPMEGR